MTSQTGSERWPLVSKDEMNEFMIRCMEAAGSSKAHATALAEVLVAADYRGHYSHGLNRLEMYVKDVKTNMTACDKEPILLKQTPATAWVDGKNVLGPVVGKMCMKLAIEKAENVGVGWVVAKGSNHYGIAGWYSLMAVNKGLMGMSFTNTSPLVVPTRASKPALGTNPIAIGAPASGDDHFMLDMATSTVAVGKIEINDRKDLPIPSGWGCDNKGLETHDPKQVLDGGGLLPLGGVELSGGYKGYGLGMMVEVLCGILGGATFGPNIRRWKDTDREADLGQCFIAVDPKAFAPDFDERLQGFMDGLRSMTPIEGESEVLIPGDPERKSQTKCDDLGGIPYHPNQIANVMELSQALHVAPPLVVQRK